MQNYTFITKQDTIEAATPFNSIITVTLRDGRLAVLPTLVARLKYHTRHITAPVRFIINVPSRYSLY